MHITAEERRSMLWLAALDWLRNCDWHFITQGRPRPLQTHWPMTDLSTALLFSLFGVTEREIGTLLTLQNYELVFHCCGSQTADLSCGNYIYQGRSVKLCAVCCFLLCSKLVSELTELKRVNTWTFLFSSNSYGCVCNCEIWKSFWCQYVLAPVSPQCERLLYLWWNVWPVHKRGKSPAPKSLSCFFSCAQGLEHSTLQPSKLHFSSISNKQ